MKHADGISDGIPAHPPEAKHSPTLRSRNWPATLLLAAILILAVGISQWQRIGWKISAMFGHPQPRDTIAWRSDFAAALMAGHRLHKPVLMDFSAPWCVPCRIMKEQVWSDPAVHQLVEKGFIPVAVDIDNTAGKNLALRYGVQAIPAIFVMDDRGHVQDASTTMNVGQTLRFLHDARRRFVHAHQP